MMRDREQILSAMTNAIAFEVETKLLGNTDIHDRLGIKAVNVSKERAEQYRNIAREVESCLHALGIKLPRECICSRPNPERGRICPVHNPQSLSRQFIENDTHEFKPYNENWAKPRCIVCQEFEEHPIHEE